MSRSILLIDDDHHLHYLNRVVLERAGFRLHSAYDGPAGLEAILIHRPDLILLDFMMPGMTGAEVFETFQRDSRFAMLKNTPVVMLTAAVHDDDVIAPMIERGLAAYLKKPFGYKELVNVIDNVLVTNSILVRDRRLMQAIKDSRDFLENLLENCPALILLADAAGTITFFSRGGQEMIGHNPETMIGQPLFRYWKDRGQTYEQLLANLRTQGVLHCDGEFISRSGQGVPVAMSFTLLRSPIGQTNGVLAIGKDLTALKALEKERLEKQRLQTLTEVFATVNHEINNPLTPILGNVQLLLADSHTLAPDAVSKLHTIAKNAHRIRELLHRLSTLTKPVSQAYYDGINVIDLSRSE
jgi:PAS domain S-box-containing protein